MNQLPRTFYARPSATVAKELIGKVLVRNLGKSKKLKGIIVETEAYEGPDDPASHAFRGKTKRNEVMFGEAGHAYIYFTYGFHHCLNFVTRNVGVPGAVLIRALEPTFGLDHMEKNRKTRERRNLASGPGKLCQAFAIDLSLNGIDITAPKSAIFVSSEKSRRLKVASGRRIGITLGIERQWRFYAAESLFVSNKKQIK